MPGVDHGENCARLIFGITKHPHSVLEIFYKLNVPEQLTIRTTYDIHVIVTWRVGWILVLDCVHSLLETLLGVNIYLHH